MNLGTSSKLFPMCKYFTFTTFANYEVYHIKFFFC